MKAGSSVDQDPTPPLKPRVIVLLGCLMAAVGPVASAQYLPRLVAGSRSVARHEAVPSHTLQRLVRAAVPNRSTLAERFIWAVIPTVLAGLAFDNREADAVAEAVAASAGVLLITRAREGMNPLGTALGAGIGATLGTISANWMDASIQTDRTFLLRVLDGWLALFTASGAALGHGEFRW